MFTYRHFGDSEGHPRQLVDIERQLRDWAAALLYARSAPRGEIKRYPFGHFDIYRGEPFERAVADQTEFLTRHLRSTHAV